MASRTRIRRRAAGGAAGAPSALLTGELAFNEQDNTLYYGKGDDGAHNATSVLALVTAGTSIDSTLTALAGTAWAANAVPVGTGADTVSQVALAANQFLARNSSGNLQPWSIYDDALAFVGAVDNAAMRTALGLGSFATQNTGGVTSNVTFNANATFDSSCIAQGIGPTTGRQHALPNVASDTVALLGIAQTFTGAMTLNGRLSVQGSLVVAAEYGNVASGGVVSISNNTVVYINTGAATKASLNFNLPASPVDGQVCRIATDAQITAISVRNAAGAAGSVIRGPTTLAAGGFCEFLYHGSATSWRRIG